MKFLLSALFSIVMVGAIAPAAAVDVETATHAKIKTSKGDIVVALDRAKAPLSVQNFLDYAKAGNYDRTLFHRVVTGFIIQGGGYSQFYNERPLRDPVPYEGDNGLKNIRGSIGMARTDNPNSAQAEWYINVRDNAPLDHQEFEGLPIYGYSVFGQVVDGMEVVDVIGAVETGAAGPFAAEVPIEPILILRVDPVDWPVADAD